MATPKKSKAASKRKAKKVSRTASTTKNGKKLGRPGKAKVPTDPSLHKDHKYMTVNGTAVPKSRVAIEVISLFLEKKDIRSIDKLNEAFPNELHPAGLIVPMAEAKKKSAKRQRFYLNEPITVGGKKFAVNREFGTNNMTPLIQAARKQGFRIQRLSGAKA